MLRFVLKLGSVVILTAMLAGCVATGAYYYHPYYYHPYYYHPYYHYYYGGFYRQCWHCW